MSRRTIIAVGMSISGTILVLLAIISLTKTTAVVDLIPSRTGRVERCLTCHSGVEQISSSHPLNEFGCISCHGGVGFATDEETAHTGLVRNPGALDVAIQYCGECHAGQVSLVQRSVMSTYAGAIAHVRRSFGLQSDDTAQFATVAVGHLETFAVTEDDPMPLQNFAANCIDCHLQTESIQSDYLYRSTGCSGCHVLYAQDGLYRGSDPSIPKDEVGYPVSHEFTTAIPYTQCNHCHNRGNYDLRTMTFVERDDMPPPDGLSERARRAHEYYQPIGQYTLCEWELDCIDCHTSQEIMGDGWIYDNRTAAQYIQCSTCHGTPDSPPLEKLIDNPDDPALLRARLNPLVNLELGTTVVATSRGESFWHIQREDNLWILTGKATGTRYEVPQVMGSRCEQKPGEQASHYCHECHTNDRSLTP